jgi:hypothetical protein
MLAKILKWSAVSLVAVLVVIQLIRPDRTNPMVDASRTLQAKIQVPADVDAILKRSCNDCHSYETRWPWYSNVAPASWLLASDVNEGREHMNFSDWALYDTDDAEDLFEEIADEVRKGGMPLSSYTFLHGEAKLTEEDKRRIIDWAQAEHRRLKSLPD